MSQDKRDATEGVKSLWDGERWDEDALRQAVIAAKEALRAELADWDAEDARRAAAEKGAPEQTEP